MELPLRLARGLLNRNSRHLRRRIVPFRAVRVLDTTEMKQWALTADLLLAAAILSLPAIWGSMILMGWLAPQLLNEIYSHRLAFGLFQIAAPSCFATLSWCVGSVASHRPELLEPDLRHRVRNCRKVALAVIGVGLLWAAALSPILRRSLEEYGTRFPSERHQVKVSPLT